MAKHAPYGAGEAFVPVDAFPAYVRAHFVRRVYSLVALQLLCTSAATACGCLVPACTRVLVAHPSALAGAFAGCVVGLAGLSFQAHRAPHNLVWLGWFTCCESYTIATVCALHVRDGAGLIVLYAAGLTACVFVALTLYACVTRRDFAFLEGFSFVLLLVSMLATLLATVASGVHVLASVLAALAYSGYVLYDTAEVMGRMSPDDAVYAALQIYIDAVGLFVHVLELLRGEHAGDAATG